MAFHTPHGSARFRLPWSWSSFNYKELCLALWEQTDARFEIAKVQARDDHRVLTDRGTIDAPLIVDALGWRRILGPGANVQPPDAAISRGLEVHPHGAGTDLDDVQPGQSAEAPLQHQPLVADVHVQAAHGARDDRQPQHRDRRTAGRRDGGS